MSEPDLREVRVLRPQPGDILFFSTDYPLTHDDAARLKSVLRDAMPTLPEDVDIIILGDIRVDVVRQP